MTQQVSVKYFFNDSFSHIFTKNPRGLAILGVVGITLAYATKKVLSPYQGSVTWGMNNPQATFLQKITCAVRQRLFGLTNKEIREKLIKIANHPLSRIPSSAPFVLGENGIYIAYGPEFALIEGKSLKDFVDLLLASEAESIINLIEEEAGQYNYLSDTNITQSGVPKTSIYGNVYKLGSKKVLHFYSWKDGTVPEGKMKNLLISLAATFAKEAADGKYIFVHSQKGLQRTSTFISSVEFIRRRDQFTGFSDANLRQAMISILEEIARTASGRVPNQVQIDMLLDPKFLRQLINPIAHVDFQGLIQ
jgi:hypothetical protein